MQLPSRDSGAKWIIGVVLLAVLVASVFFMLSLGTTTQVQLGDRVIQARVANSPSEREKGLSGTKNLTDAEGMLFIFETSGKWQFWMHDMHVDLDIIWINDRKRVVDITPNVTPESYPEVFKPTVPAKYAVEVPAGFAERYHVTVGSTVYFSVPGE